MENWVAEVRGEMYINKVTNLDIADHLGVSPQYVSYIFNGKRNPIDAEMRMRTAVAEIIEQRRASHSPSVTA